MKLENASKLRLMAAAMLLFPSAAATTAPLMSYNGRLFVDATVNGRSAKALLDSAAEATVVDRQFAKIAELPDGTEQMIRGSGGTAQARVVEGVALKALGMELHPEAVIVTDLSDLSQRLVKRTTQVILGREIFDAARLQIDIAGGRIDVMSRAAEPRGDRLPLAPHAGVETIPVLANGESVQAEFDLGNGSGLIISRALARKLHVKIVGHKSGGGIGGKVRQDLVVLRTLKVGRCFFRNVPAAIDDQSNAAPLNVGTSILKHFLVTTDFRARAVWLDPHHCA